MINDQNDNSLGDYYMDFTQQFLETAALILKQVDTKMVDRAIQILADGRNNGGRLFILGLGGSAANASHAVNDFRKLAGFEAYAPTENVSELTARINDEGWISIFEAWLMVSRLTPRDVILVFSVGGGSLEKNVSPNLVTAIQYAKKVGAKIVGVVGRDGGYTLQTADACVLIPVVDDQLITPFTEASQATIWHLMVSHPLLKTAPTKWESMK
jgi:D-sedoheptulose 7-phosphate isomerase